MLIVEGYSDLWFYAEVLEHLGKLEGVFIKEFGGKSNISTQLEVFLTPQLLEDKTHIGVIVDADQSSEGTFAGLQTAIANATGQTVPAPGAWTEGNPRIGLFVAPDPCTPGEIETLVWRAWAADPDNRRAKDCIDTFADSMKVAGHEAKSREKGLIGALLAIRNDDDPRLGPGARANVFDLDRPELSALREFLAGF